MTNKMRTIIQTRPINLMVAFDDVIEVVTVKAKLTISGDLDYFRTYYPFAQRRVNVFFDELNGAMVSALSHPISKIIGTDDDDDEDIDDIEFLEDEEDTLGSLVNELKDELKHELEDEGLSEEDIDEINKEIKKQFYNSIRTEKYINIPLLECPIAFPTDSVIACLLYEKMSSIIEVFDIDEMEFVTTNINTNEENIFLIDQATSDMLIGDILDDYRQKLSSFFDNSGIEFNEGFWWERVDMTVGDMWRMEREEYDELFEPLLVKDTTEETEDLDSDTPKQKLKPKQKPEPEPEPEPEDDSDPNDIIEVE